jgi:hypothetical protein
MELSRESVRAIRHRNWFHYYDSIPIQSLQLQGKELRRIFCEGQLQRDDRLPIIFTDESTVAQDMNQGRIWERKGEFLPDATSEQAQHPITVMVWGAIGPGFRSPSLRTHSIPGTLYSNSRLFKLLQLHENLGVQPTE